MFSVRTKKILMGLILLPLGVFFLSCCCLTAETKAAKAPAGCKSCPQKQKSQDHADCPHANVKAVFAAHASDLKVVSDFSLPAVFGTAQYRFADPQFVIIRYQHFESPPITLSLYSQNPVLRV